MLYKGYIKSKGKAAIELEKPDANGRRSRTGRKKAEATTEPTEQNEPPKKRERKSRAEVQAENEQKIADHMTAVDEAIDEAFPGQEEVPFDEAAEIADSVPKPDLQKPPRRTRKERVAETPAEPESAADEVPENAETPAEPLEDAMNPPEPPVRGQRRRRTR